MLEKRTSKDWRARAAAYLEAAEHLDQSWTEDIREREQGVSVKSALMAKVNECEVNAERLERIERDPTR